MQNESGRCNGRQNEKKKDTGDGGGAGKSGKVQARNYMRELYVARPSDIRELFLSAL